MASQKIKLIQWAVPRLQIDQSTISKMALQLHEDGTWILNLRGDQNPSSTKPTDDGKGIAAKHLKRNLFQVKLRCRAGSGGLQTKGETSFGVPVLVELEPIQFWVEKGPPHYLVKQAHDELGTSTHAHASQNYLTFK